VDLRVWWEAGSGPLSQLGCRDRFLVPFSYCGKRIPHFAPTKKARSIMDLASLVREEAILTHYFPPLVLARSGPKG